MGANNANLGYYFISICNLTQILIFVFIFKAPPKPTKKEIPEILGKTTTTVSLQYKKGLFSDENGQVLIIRIKLRPDLI